MEKRVNKQERRADPPAHRDLEKRLERFLSRALAAFAVLGISCAVSLLGFGIVLDKQGEQADDIQQQRFDSIKRACEDTNARNKNVNAQIDSAIANLPADKKAKAEKQSAPFRAIISAAVPYTSDCEAYAQDRVKGTE